MPKRLNGSLIRPIRAFISASNTFSPRPGGTLRKSVVRCVFSPDDLATSSFNFEIETKSINTANSKRDNHLVSGDFFDSSNYPLIKFKSTAIKHVKGQEYLLERPMTVKDVSKNVSVPLTLLGMKPFPFDKNKIVAGMEARMKLDRLEYKVGNGKFPENGCGRKIRRCVDYTRIDPRQVD